MFEEIVDKEKFTVKIQSMSSNESPIIITQKRIYEKDEGTKELSGSRGMYGLMPELYNLDVNANHELISSILLRNQRKKEAR